MAAAEPFPILSTSADQLHATSNDANTAGAAARRRRKSSGLGERVGDTGAPGLATSLAHLSAAHGSHTGKV
jgi:acyl-CoA-dependent ceramide synthase